MQYFKLFNDYESKTISWGYALILQNPFCFVLHLILQALLSLCVHFISGLLLSNQWNNWNLAQGISPTFIITQFLTFLQYVYAVIPKFCFLNSFIFILCSQAKEVKKPELYFRHFQLSVLYSNKLVIAVPQKESCLSYVKNFLLGRFCISKGCFEMLMCHIRKKKRKKERNSRQIKSYVNYNSPLTPVGRVKL